MCIPVNRIAVPLMLSHASSKKYIFFPYSLASNESFCLNPANVYDVAVCRVLFWCNKLQTWNTIYEGWQPIKVEEGFSWPTLPHMMVGGFLKMQHLPLHDRKWPWFCWCVTSSMTVSVNYQVPREERWLDSGGLLRGTSLHRQLQNCHMPGES